MGCEALIPDKEYPFYLKNDGSKDIYFNIVYSYPDTLLPETLNYVFLVKAGEKQLMTASTHKLSAKEFAKYFPSDTLCIIFFSADTLNTYNWDIVRNEYKILERREYSYQDLENTSWTITYP